MFNFDILYGASTAASWMIARPDRVPSLLDCCSRFIVTSWHVARASLNVLPHDLYKVLLGEACKGLLSSNSGTPGLFLTYIVQRWPSAVLKPGDMIGRHRLDLKENGKKTRDLVMHIVNGVCQPESQCKLTVLDLSDIPMSSSICHSALLKFCMSLISGRSLTIVMDLNINAENYQPLRRLLREIQRSKYGSLKVQCRRLTANFLGRDRLLKVTAVEEPDTVVALNLDWNRLENQGLLAILPSMVKFLNLQALSLSYNLIRTLMSGDQTGVAAEAFSNLKHLRRLNLSHNILTGSLRILLESLPQCLLALYLGGCKLSSPDLSYLANSRHAKTLRELDLGLNNLKHEALSLEKLLSEAGKTLQYLGLDNTRLNLMGSPVQLSARLSHSLPALIAMSMRGNDFSAENQMIILKNLAENAHSLVYIGVCMVYDDPETENDFFHEEWYDYVSDDRVTQFFDLYNACKDPEEQEDPVAINKTRSVIVHDLDVVSKRDALIFIHNLYQDQRP